MAVRLILLRHGQSEWNRLNLFTGWVDIPLSQKGVEESVAAGQKIASIPIDCVYTSSLIRAQMTALLALLPHTSKKVPVIMHEGEAWSAIHSPKAEEQVIPVYCAQELNERMYGELQGMNKQEMREKFGEEQVHQWRRSFDQAPPGGESLEQTAQRAIPYFQKEILPAIQRGKTVLISAHGNSLRSIVMFLEGLSKSQVLQLELATGEPRIYTFTAEQWRRDE